MEQNKLEALLGQISRFPESSGVYIMKDSNSKPIYIGKALNLKSRVRSYFFDSHEDRAQIPVMLKKVDHIEWIATNNETEALILEANLIRKEKPKYNVDLRDDKHFPYLKVTTKEPFPRLMIVRRVEKDGSVYFGPYTDVASMRRIADFARRIFKIRDCHKVLPLSKPVRPCINFSMKRCSGPCGEKISKEQYRQSIEDLVGFLKGRRNDLMGELEKRMQNASENLRFEEAAAVRDQLALIKVASRLQKVDLKLTDVDCDVFGLAQGEREMCLAVLHFREGLLMASRHFLFSRSIWDFSQSNHDPIIIQFYLREGQEIPREVIIPNEAGFDINSLKSWFSEERRAEVLSPQKGTKCHLVAMAKKNAELYLAQKVPPSATQDLLDLQNALNLPSLPQTIEAFDISNLGGSFTVAGMVQFVGGLPNKSAYRRYKIKSVEGQNDFAMMMEVVQRRLCRLEEEGSEFPDLLLIDGGKGQLNAAIGAVANFKNPPSLVSLAKQEETLYSVTTSGPVQLPQTHPARRLVERIRDEVHRYAVSYHRKIRGRQFSTSSLERIPGIGKKRAGALLKHFGSLSRVCMADSAQIAQVEGFSKRSAEELLNALAKKKQ